MVKLGSRTQRGPVDGNPAADETIEEMVKRLEQELDKELENSEADWIVVDLLVKVATSIANGSDDSTRNNKRQ